MRPRRQPRPPRRSEPEVFRIVRNAGPQPVAMPPELASVGEESATPRWVEESLRRQVERDQREASARRRSA